MITLQGGAHMTPFRLMVLGLVLVANFSLYSRAESPDCATPVLIIPDGRVTQSSFSQNTTYWYGIYAQAGHSYSVEFEPPADNFPNTIRVQFAAPNVYGPNDS